VEWSIAPRILNLGTRWQIYSRGKKPEPTEQGAAGAQSRSGRSGEDKKYLLLTVVEILSSSIWPSHYTCWAIPAKSFIIKGHKSTYEIIHFVVKNFCIKLVKDPGLRQCLSKNKMYTEIAEGYKPDWIRHGYSAACFPPMKHMS